MNIRGSFEFYINKLTNNTNNKKQQEKKKVEECMTGRITDFLDKDRGTYIHIRIICNTKTNIERGGGEENECSLNCNFVFAEG